tara:strand:+ start:154 stop:2379 length:2226 start_codon:yes stop_codon:yes gene_type:complete
MSNLIDLDGLDLGSLDEKGKPVETRLKDVKAAVGIFATLLRADEKSAVNRSRIDSMFDGVAPYNESQLASSGQGLKTNLNFGEAQRLLDISLSAYVDLYSSLERLVEVKATTGERSEVGPKEDIVAQELTDLFRRWPEFHSSYLRLCTQFIKHGVGVAYFDSPEDWKFRVGGFADILIPRQSQASENAIDIAVGRRQYQLHELYHFIKNEKAAKAVGWNVAEVKRVMMENVKTSGRAYTSGNTYSDYESLQAEIKNNDLYTGIQNPTVDVLHYWVREIDGSVSHYISAESSPKDFLYKKVSRYDSPEQAYIFFTYGVGSNGTYHSIRGLGQRIFSHIQTSNRLRCQQIDGAMLASAVMIQPENQRSLDELSFTFYGAYAVMSPNVKIVEKAIPNLGTAVQPALQDLTQQLNLNTDTMSPYGPNQTSPYKNQMQVVADMDVATRISGSTLNLFYSSWTRLMREMVRRIVQVKRPDAAIKDFFDRCEKRGVEKEFIKKLDVAQTKAVRSIGNGSQANRLVSLRELQGISGQFDDVGRRNLTRDIVSTRVGHDLADRYVPAQESERQTVDTKIAYLENQQLQQGQQVPVVSSELHGQHLQLHVPLLQQFIQAINEGQADPQQVLPALQALYQHISETAQYASGDPALGAVVSNAQQILQYAEEAINNTMKALEKIQREQQQQISEEGAGQPQMSEVDMKLQKAQVDMQITQQKAELEMAIKQKKFDQEQAIRDAQAALKFREQE